MSMLKRCLTSVLLIALGLPAVAAARPASITEFPLPTANSEPIGITTGPDGALWFTEGGNRNAIGRITTAGNISEFPVPTPASNVDAITTGPDGALWFTEEVGNKIGRITTTGSITEFPLPNSFSAPTGITAGPDGALWFTETSGNRIGRITTSGSIQEFSVPLACCGPDDITAGPDGALWFTEYGSPTGAIGRITVTGAFTLFPLPAGNEADAIAVGRDGALWFTGGAGIGRVTTTGSFSQFSTPTPVIAITAGPHRPMWFTAGGDQVGRVTVKGRIGEFRVPTSGATPNGITTGPDGALWFTETFGDKIGRITPGRARSEAFVQGEIHVEPPLCAPDAPCLEGDRYIFDATSQPINHNPAGTVTFETGERAGLSINSGQVTCLRTSGNRATVGVNFGATLEPAFAALIFVVANGSETADMIAVETLPAGTAPSTCPANPPAGVAYGPGYPGQFDGQPGPGVTISYLPTGPR